MMKKNVWLVLPFALIFFSCMQAGKIENPGDNNSFAPEFILEDLNGNQISLSDYEGKVIFLNFWATWCPPCRNEIPGFVEAYEKYKDKGMEIIGISLDRISRESLLQFVEKYKMDYPIAFGTQKLLLDYDPGQYIPTTFIIDKNGKIKHKHVGFLDRATLKDYFLALVEED